MTFPSAAANTIGKQPLQPSDHTKKVYQAKLDFPFNHKNTPPKVVMIINLIPRSSPDDLIPAEFYGNNNKKIDIVNFPTNKPTFDKTFSLRPLSKSAALMQPFLSWKERYGTFWPNTTTSSTNISLDSNKSTFHLLAGSFKPILLSTAPTASVTKVVNLATISSTASSQRNQQTRPRIFPLLQLRLRVLLSQNVPSQAKPKMPI
jgi:hypothetical protein